MKTYNKAQFIEKFSDKKDAIAFVKPNGRQKQQVYNVTGIDPWKLVELFPDDARFDVCSFSDGLSDNKLLQRTFNEGTFGFYSEKWLSEYQEIEDDGDGIYVAYIRSFKELLAGMIASQYPYEATEKMVRRALGKSCCKMLDLRDKKVRNVCQYVRTDYYSGLANYATREDARAAVEREVKKFQTYIRGVLGRCKEIDIKGMSLDEGAKVWLTYQKQLEKQQEKEQKAREKAEAKALKKYEAEQERVSKMIDGNYSVDEFLDKKLRTGDHTYKHNGHIADENNITCDEERYFDGYSRSCSFPMIRRQFVLYIKRGYRVRVVGGLITFYNGEFKRQGMKVEWIEQGRAIADLTKHAGYLVRGEHIEAKSLREAIRINEEHRAMTLARLLSKRKRAERREEEKQNGNLKITFADSLNAGNCRPGTQEFKNRYEEAIGHKATSISIADLRKYAKEFGVEYYAEQAIAYALNH